MLILTPDASAQQRSSLVELLAPPPQSVPGQVLVKFKEGTPAAHKTSAFDEVGTVAREHIFTSAMKQTGDQGVVVLTITGDVTEAIQSLRSNYEVEFAEPNWVYKHYATSNDPSYLNGQLWGMLGDATTPKNVYGSQAGEAWAAGNTGNSSVLVGIIDEGADYTHPDLAANFWTNPYDPVDGVDNDGNGYVDDIHGWDFAGNNNGTFDGGSDDHGTHVAGTIGAVGGNGIGVVGVNWNVKLISAKFLSGPGGTTANAIKAVDYFTNLKNRHGLNIVATNNSWGGGGFSQGLQDAIERANAANIVFVAAAGNEGYNIDVTASYPGGYPNANIITVAAIASNGTKPSWSNYGATKVDIAAPGASVYSTIPSKRYGSMSGTSMAAPHVTGAAALYAATRPGASVATIKSAILGAAVPTSSMSGRCVTGGRLNVSGF
jgi:subtilisin family serine protease